MAASTLMGNKIRERRRELGMSQRALAQRVGISPSYMNLIENDRRSATAALQVEIARSLDVDVKKFAEDVEAIVAADLVEAFSDPLFDSVPAGEHELRQLALRHPAVGGAMLALYRAYRNNLDELAAISERLSDDQYLDDADFEFRSLLTAVRSSSEILRDNADMPLAQRQQFVDVILKDSERLSPVIDRLLGRATAGKYRELGVARSAADEVADAFQSWNNYLAVLEDAAEALGPKVGFAGHGRHAGLIGYLHDTHGVAVEIASAGELGGAVRYFSPTSKRLMLSDELSHGSQTFQLAVQVGLLELQTVFDEIISEATFSGEASRVLCRIALANYFSAALLMPYDSFLAAARELRYDIDRLRSRYGVSFEQACHRLTTLQRPGDSGVPFHLIRVDIAGNISLRFSASGMRIPRYGGACPRWSVHAAFLTPGEIVTQLGAMPDGRTFFTIARTVSKGGAFGAPRSHLSIALGCEASHADQLVYADGVDIHDVERAMPIGVSCRICERLDCRQRAFTPISHRLELDTNLRGPSVHATFPVPLDAD